jgi:hypothetical protein
VFLGHPVASGGDGGVERRVGRGERRVGAGDRAEGRVEGVGSEEHTIQPWDSFRSPLTVYGWKFKISWNIIQPRYGRSRFSSQFQSLIFHTSSSPSSVTPSHSFTFIITLVQIIQWHSFLIPMVIPTPVPHPPLSSVLSLHEDQDEAYLFSCRLSGLSEQGRCPTL